MEIGQKIRNLRTLKGLTQEELADRSELTKGFISQLENDQTTPSLETFLDLLNGLGVSPSEFFQEEEEEKIVFHDEDYCEKEDPELLNKIEWIIPNAQKNEMEPIRLTLEKGGSTYPDNPHEGEEFGYVLDGSVEIHLGKKVFRAKTGESFYYKPEKKHYLSSKSGAKILWVSAPPSF